MAFTPEQRRNAAIIYAVGRDVGASLRDIQIAIMAAIVESGLRNLDYGDLDSIGMFQQRDAWGSRRARLNPYKSARMFFLGGHGGQQGLLDKTNRNQMTMGQAAQAVQVSAFPDRYAEHQQEAAALLRTLGNGKIPKGNDSLADVVGDINAATLGDIGDIQSLTQLTKQLNLPEPPSVTEVNGLGEITADETGLGELQFGADGSALSAPQSSPLDAMSFDQGTTPQQDPMSDLLLPELDLKQIAQETSGVGDFNFDAAFADGGAEGWRGAVVAAARKMLGVPYVWGGESPNGVDCSGLIALIYNKRGFNLPRVSADQARAGNRISLSALKPGDLVAWNNSSRNVGADHIAIYIGNGLIIEAPRPGGVVQISGIYDTGNAWGVRVNRR